MLTNVSARNAAREIRDLCRTTARSTGDPPASEAWYATPSPWKPAAKARGGLEEWVLSACPSTWTSEGGWQELVVKKVADAAPRPRQNRRPGGGAAPPLRVPDGRDVDCGQIGDVLNW